MVYEQFSDAQRTSVSATSTRTIQLERPGDQQGRDFENGLPVTSVGRDQRTPTGMPRRTFLLIACAAIVVTAGASPLATISAERSTNSVDVARQGPGLPSRLQAGEPGLASTRVSENSLDIREIHASSLESASDDNPLQGWKLIKDGKPLQWFMHIQLTVSSQT